MTNLELFIKSLQDRMMQSNPDLWWEICDLIVGVKEEIEPTGILEEEVLQQEEECGEESAECLKPMTPDDIAKTRKILLHRQEVVQALKEIVFNKEFNAYEVKHVQEILGKNYWLFGEQYHLIAIVPDFELALKEKWNYLKKNKEMDIFMVRQDQYGEMTKNVVVILKNPNIKLGEKELSEVKKYMRAIKKEPKFNTGNVKWTFYLVGNDFSSGDYILAELESHKNFGEQHLVHSQDNELTKIYVLKWSELFDDYSKRHNFLMQHFQ